MPHDGDNVVRKAMLSEVLVEGQKNAAFPLGPGDDLSIASSAIDVADGRYVVSLLF